jgi:hypothetical protein
MRYWRLPSGRNMRDILQPCSGQLRRLLWRSALKPSNAGQEEDRVLDKCSDAALAVVGVSLLRRGP